MLPSSRACKTLGRILLEESGCKSLLLPRILTDEQWAGEAALGLGKSALELPDDRVRPVLLAHALVNGVPDGPAKVPWSARGTRSARPVRRQTVSSRRRAPRPWMYNAW